MDEALKALPTAAGATGAPLSLQSEVAALERKTRELERMYSINQEAIEQLNLQVSGGLATKPSSAKVP